MSLTPNNVSYHDLASLQQISSHAGKDEKAALRQAAEQFESIFFGMLLSSMRKANAAFEVDGMMNSQTTKFYRDMHDSQMATDLAQKGALGLADLLVEQLSPALGKNATASKAADNETKALQMPKYILPALKTSAAPVSAAGATAAAAQAAGGQIITAQPQTVKPAWQVTSPEQFVQTLLPAARATAKTLGLDPLALIAQAALETGWGQRVIKTAKGESSFNLFGIKANHGWQGKPPWSIPWNIAPVSLKKSWQNSALILHQSIACVIMPTLLSKTRVIRMLCRLPGTLKLILSSYKLRVMPQIRPMHRKLWRYIKALPLIKHASSWIPLKITVAMPMNNKLNAFYSVGGESNVR
jgi:flagellar rod assembly protein/muramidase FlgJ